MALGGRVKKYEPLLEFIGTLDEANSALGLAGGLCEESDSCSNKIIDNIIFIQKIFFKIGFSFSKKKIYFENNILYEIEKKIDDFMNDIKLKGFILPGGCSVCGSLHLARAILRRAERLYWRLADEGAIPLEDTDIKLLGAVLNRLSDLLFAMAVYVAREAEKLEYVSV